MEHGLINIRGSITSIRQIHVIAVMLIKDNPGRECDSCKRAGFKVCERYGRFTQIGVWLDVFYIEEQDVLCTLWL